MSLSRVVQSLSLSRLGRLSMAGPSCLLTGLAGKSPAMPLSSRLLCLSSRPLVANPTSPMIDNRRWMSQIKSNQELTEFLEHEITLEKNSQRKGLPELTGWKVITEGATVTLTKTFNGEEITLKANVNHAVDAEAPTEEQVQQEQQMQGEMTCKPDFAVEIKKGDEILGINCSLTHYDEEEPPEPDEVDDPFQINEISVFKGEFKETNYLVSGEVMDVNMYDLIMNLLGERGIDDEFVKKLVDFCTVYEHGQYIGMLEKLKGFINKK